MNGPDRFGPAPLAHPPGSAADRPRARSGARGIPRVVAFVLSLLALPAPAQGLLEHVRGDDGEAWLLGSLHFGSDDLYPLGDRIERAFAASDRLMVEVNLLDLDAAQVRSLLERYGAYPRGETLRGHLSEPLWRRLVAAGAALGLAPGSFDQHRPWLAALNVTAAFLEKHGLTPAQGVDQHFLRRARRAGLPILEIESFAEQITLLHATPREDQLLMLEDTLEQVEAGGRLADELLTAWRTGDRAALHRVLLGALSDSAQGRRLTRRLLDARNPPMARRVAAEIARGGSVFVVIGAAHMLGPHSVPVYLEQLGLAVSRR